MEKLQQKASDLHKFGIHAEIRAWADKIDKELGEIGHDNSYGEVGQLIYLIDYMGRALWGALHEPEDIKWDYVEAKLSHAHEIMEGIQERIMFPLPDKKLGTNYLDTEKIRWMLNRDDPVYGMDDLWEIYIKLRQGQIPTMRFLMSCSEEELEKLEWVIKKLMTDFSDRYGNGKFIDFLEHLGEAKCPKILEILEEFKEEMQEKKDCDEKYEPSVFKKYMQRNRNSNMV